MPDAKNTTEATQWCKDARDLVGARRGKSAALKAARDQLSAVVTNMERTLTRLATLRAERFEEFNPRYLRLSGVALEAAKSTRNDQAFQDAAGALQALQVEIDAAITMQVALANELARFDKAHAALQVSVAEAAGLRGARSAGSPVKAALDEAVSLLADAHTLRDNAQADNQPLNLQAAHGQLALVKPKLAQVAADAKKGDADSAGYLKAMAAWSALKPQVQAALQELKSLPGAEKVASDLQTDFNDAVAGIRQTPDGLWTGHAEAVDKLRHVNQSLSNGRGLSSALMARELPAEVVGAWDGVKRELDRHADVAPPYATQSAREEATSAAQGGRVDAPGALARLNALQARVKADADRLGAERALALAAQTRMNTALAAVAALKVPPALQAPLERAGRQVEQGELAERQWPLATTRLGDAATALEALQAEFAAHGAAWAARKAELEAIVKQCIAFIGFPVLAPAALPLRDTAAELLKGFGVGRLQTAIDACSAARVNGQTLADAMAALTAAARAKQVPLDDADAQAAFVKALAKGTGEVLEAAEKTRGFVRSFLDGKELDARLRALLQRDWFARTAAVEATWQTFRNSAGGDPATLDAALKSAHAALKKLQADLEAMKLTQLKTQATALATAESASGPQEATKRLHEALDKLRALGEDVSAEQSQLKAGKVEWRDLWAAISARLDAALQAQATARKALLDKIGVEIDAPLKDADLSATYRKELAQSSNDIKQMVNTEDPDLLAVAQAMQARMKAQVDAIAANPKLYSANKKTLEGQAERVGALLEHLPETHRRLRTALTEELVQAKHTDPVAMKARVEAFVKRVDEAHAAKLAHDAEVEVFNKAKKKLKEDFEAMKSLTGTGKTTLTAKAAAFEAYYEQRRAEAKAMRRVEGAMPQAMAIVAMLQAKVDAISKDANPLAKLREVDAEEAQNQRLMGDLSRQFERALSSFLATTLVQARQAAQAAGDGNTPELQGLEQLATSARRIVSPYLSNLDLLPRGNQPAPELAKLKADFATAQKMLADAQRAAERLINNPLSTSVGGPGLGGQAVRDGLAKLSRKWGERTQAYGSALRSVVGAIRGAAAADPPDIKAQAEAAAKLIESQLVGLFRSEAFASAFAVLQQTPPAEAAAAKALADKQRAAREAALRLTRQALADMQHPMLMRLTQPASNPFEAPTMRVAAAGVATVLKEIQLQVLAAA